MSLKSIPPFTIIGRMATIQGGEYDAVTGKITYLKDGEGENPDERIWGVGIEGMIGCIELPGSQLIPILN